MADNDVKTTKNDSEQPKKSRFSFKKLGKNIVKFFREYKSEFKKIVWPTPKQILNNTIVTLVLCLVVGVFIWLLDLGLGYGIQFIYNLGA